MAYCLLQMPFLCCWRKVEEETGDTEELREVRVGLRSKRPGPPAVGGSGALIM